MREETLSLEDPPNTSLINEHFFVNQRSLRQVSSALRIYFIFDSQPDYSTEDTDYPLIATIFLIHFDPSSYEGP